MLNLSYIQAFITIAKTGSFKKASERLFVDVSTLSRQIKALEDALGLPLLIRYRFKGTVSLTSQGQLLLPIFKRLQKDLDLLHKKSCILKETIS